MIDPLAHIRNWIFDLDNTLYPPENDLFGLIDAKMGAYIADLLTLDAAGARLVQKEYFKRHGTTLARDRAGPTRRRIPRHALGGAAPPERRAPRQPDLRGVGRGALIDPLRMSVAWGCL